jgi:hypothetical protein
LLSCFAGAKVGIFCETTKHLRDFLQKSYVMGLFLARQKDDAYPKVGLPIPFDNRSRFGGRLCPPGKIMPQIQGKPF